MIDKIIYDSKPLYNVYNSIKRLKLKGVKYFIKPVPCDNIEELKLSDEKLNNEYNEIIESTFRNILGKTPKTKNMPFYLENYRFKLDDFVLDCMEFLDQQSLSFNVKAYLEFLHEILLKFNISHDYSNLKEYLENNPKDLNKGLTNFEFNNSNNYWIHNTDANLLDKINEQLIIGAQKPKSPSFKNIKLEDFILFYSKFEYDKTVKNRFYGFSKVDEIYHDSENLYDFYKSKKKLKIKPITYFKNPINYKSLINDLELFERYGKPETALKEYNNLSFKDFKEILNKTVTTDSYPDYLINIKFRADSFLLKSIEVLYMNYKLNYKLRALEIPKFIKSLQKFLKIFNIQKDYSELEEFYSRNIWKLNIKHGTSRNSEKNVELYGKSGQKVLYGLISFE